jgi:hypothetical protein
MRSPGTALFIGPGSSSSFLQIVDQEMGVESRFAQMRNRRLVGSHALVSYVVYS